MQHYVILGGKEGKERLKLLNELMQPTTAQLLNTVGIGTGMKCLDVGCGGGHITLYLAERVGPQGKVVGTDLDGKILSLAQQDAEAAQVKNLEFRQADALQPQEEATYDLVYARFLLTHLSEPEKCMAAMVRSCRPGGFIIVEDIEISSSFCYPRSASYDKYIALYKEVVHRRGGDPDVGPKLPGMLRNAGVEGVQVNVVQPTYLAGEGKLLTPITMNHIAASVISEKLAAEEEVKTIINALNDAATDSETVMSLARVFQAWGQKV
jgi:SAM-dependent methyltransferase